VAVSVGAGGGVHVGLGTTSAGVGGGVADELVAVGVGVGVLLAAGVTGQVATFELVAGGLAGVAVLAGVACVAGVAVLTGVACVAVLAGVACVAGVPEVETADSGELVTGLAAEVEVSAVTLDGPVFAPVAPVAPLAVVAPVAPGSGVGAHPAADAECGPVACDCPVMVAVLPWPPGPVVGVAPSATGVPPPAWVPLPSVPALPRGWPLPPFSEVLAWRIAWRNGCTPSATLAMTATPPTTVTSRSHLMSHLRSRRGKLVRLDRRSQRAPNPDSASGQAQCPRQVQFLARSRIPKRTLNSQGRGGRSPIRVRILSSPSPLAWT
jgi:hypothetical protein